MDHVTHYEYQSGGLMKCADPDRPMCEAFVLLAHQPRPHETRVVAVYFDEDDASRIAKALNSMKTANVTERVVNALMFDLSGNGDGDGDGAFWDKFNELITRTLPGDKAGQW